MLFKRLDLLLTVLVWLISCTPSSEESGDSIKYPEPGHNLTPRQLAEAYCGSCHLFPEPDLLARSQWEQNVLKDMGRRLGIISDDYDPFKQRSMLDAFIIRNAGIYPEDTLISDHDWKQIVNYYLEHAPTEPLTEPSKPPITGELPHFSIKIFDDLPAPPLTTMVKFDTTTGLIYWGSRSGDLMVVAKNGKIHRQIELESPPSHLSKEGTRDLVLSIGVMDPSEESQGKLLEFDSNYHAREVLTSLQRPLFYSAADLDEDGIKDLIISQFGDQTGKLSWFKQINDGTYQEYIIKDIPGTLKTEIHDFNQDGRLDVMALTGQGNEGISIFFNQGRGLFYEKQVLRFPPVYGSSSFQLVDFNQDGHLDILYTCGDNGDFTFSLKNYHGVRIFLNNGEYNFSEEYFYPMYGTMKASAGDFDLDGDLDLFAISFFPDFESENPEGFVYLQNQGDLNFQPFSFPEAVNGRWLVADAADFDRDGDLDIVLGSLLFKIKAAPQQLVERWTQSNYQMILLENSIR